MGEIQYLNLLKKLINEGVEKTNRTGINTLSLFGEQMRFDLTNDSFPLLTTRKIYFNSIVEELLWFLRGNTDSKILSKRGVKIWDANGSRQFLDSVGFHNREDGDLGPIYGFQWRHFGATYKTCNDNYENQGVDQILNIIKQLKENPDDRRIILCSWNPMDIHKMALPPCHCLAQFYVNKNKLSCQLYQRSADMVLGVPFNIASYSLLTKILAHLTNLEAYEFIHVLGDYHIYINHLDTVKLQLKNKPLKFPKLKIEDNGISKIEDFSIKNFILTEYNHHPKLFFKLVV